MSKIDEWKNGKASVNVKLDATLSLQEMFIRMVDVVNELGAYYNVLSNEIKNLQLKKVCLIQLNLTSFYVSKHVQTLLNKLLIY